MITFEKREAYNPIRSGNVTITYRVKLDGKWVGTIKHKRTEGWRYHPRGGKPGEAFKELAECKRSLEAPPPDKLDSLIRKAFTSTEGELAGALVEAEHALAESLKCKDPGEIIAELSGALRRLVNLLGSTSSN